MLRSEDKTERAEAEAFILGFAFCWKCFAIANPLADGKVVAANGKPIAENEQALFEEVKALAQELWPPFDPAPVSKKKSKVGMKELWEEKIRQSS